MPQTPRFSWNTWVANQAQPNQTFNNFLVPASFLLGANVLSRSTTAQPGSPTSGDAYIIPSGATGAAWTTFSVGDVAFYYSDGTTASWYAVGPETGLVVRVADEGGLLQFDGSAWSGIPSAINAQTGAAYELVLGDQVVTMDNGAGNTLTIPANSATAFPVGTEILVIQLGAGSTSIAITTDTLLGATSVAGQNQARRLVKLAATTWISL